MQVLVQGAWQQVCAKDSSYGLLFDDVAADIVCRQLGYVGGLAPSSATDYGGNRVTSFKLTSFCVPETTATLSNCLTSVDNNYCISMAWVTCSNDTGERAACLAPGSQDPAGTWLCRPNRGRMWASLPCHGGGSQTLCNPRWQLMSPSAPCPSNATAAVPPVPVKLLGPDLQPASSGRLVAYRDGLWAPVAATGNITALAAVVCRQLNYSTGLAASLGMYHASDPSAQRSFNCTGKESALASCTYGGLVGGYSEVEVACAAAGGALRSGLMCRGSCTVIF